MPISISSFKIKPSLRTRLLLGCGASLALGVLARPACAQASAPAPSVQAPPSSPPSSGSILGQMGRELSYILLQNRNGVVTIRGHRLLTPAMLLAAGGEKMPFGMSAPPGGMSPILPIIGSGFLVQGNVVVTTAEVAEDIQNPTVILADRRHLRVTASSVDTRRNLAILIVEETDPARALHLGDSDSVQPGMLAVTIGTQAGFANSSGLAFIAQTKRAASSGDHRYDNLIQFQGAVGPGSSGSPLLDSNGAVIGIVMAAPDMTSGGRGTWPGMGRGRQNEGKGGEQNRFDKTRPDKSVPDTNARAHRNRLTSDMQRAPGNPNDPHGPHPGGPPAGFGFNDMAFAGFNPFGGLSSIGFALPINDLRARLADLVKTAQKVPAAGWMGVRPGNGAKPGAYVTNLYEDSPADQAGLKIGDIITQIDGQPIRSDGEFIGALVRGHEGQVMKVQVLRGGVTRVFEIRLRARPDPEEMRRMNLRRQAEVGVRIEIYFSCAV